MNISEMQRENSVEGNLSDKELTLQSYDDTALEYANNVESLHPHKQAEIFLSMVPPCGTILDLGCGSGRDAKIFSDRGFEVTGIDFSYGMIEIAKAKAPKATFHVMDMQALRLSDTFDAVWANASLLHISKQEMPKVLEKVCSILKDKGVFYLSLKQGSHQGLETDRRYKNAQKFFSYFEVEELEGLLFDAQFEIVKIFIGEKSSSYQTHPFINAFCRRK